MEARFLQMELESLLEDRIFLDSDDLRSLDRLVDHVKRTGCVLLVQTKSVLTRPFCLLELLTAIEQGIAIVGVTVSTGSYEFSQATSFLTSRTPLLSRCRLPPPPCRSPPLPRCRSSPSSRLHDAGP